MCPTKMGRGQAFLEPFLGTFPLSHLDGLFGPFWVRLTAGITAATNGARCSGVENDSGGIDYARVIPTAALGLWAAHMFPQSR